MLAIIVSHLHSQNDTGNILQIYNCTCRQLGRTADETNTRYQYVHLIMKSLVLLGRVALGAQRPIVVKLPRERSVGRSVRLSVGLSSEL